MFKERDKAEKSNYRPISILPAISRLLEKLITDQLYEFIDDNGLRLHSALICLLESIDDWYRRLDLGNKVGIGIHRSQKSR